MRISLLALAGVVLAAPLGAQDPSDADGTPFFLRKVPPPADALKAYQEQPYRPVRPSEVRAGGFLTEGQEIAFGRAVGPAKSNRSMLQASSAATALGGAFSVEPPEGANYQVGDTLVVAIRAAGPKNWGDRVIPTGLVVVTGQADGHANTEVVAIYGPMRAGQVVYRAEPFANPGEATPVPSPAGPTGAVIETREIRELLLPSSHVYTDLGQRDGVKVGDFVELRRAAVGGDDGSSRLAATGQVVHVSPNSSTVKLTNVLEAHIVPGMPVVRVATLP